MTIRAGSLNSRVRIKEPNATQDSAGQPIPTWTTVADVWANIRHLSGVESIKAGAESSTVKASIMIRRIAGIDASMRVTDLSTLIDYEIRAVLPDEIERDKIHLVCEVVHG